MELRLIIAYSLIALMVLFAIVVVISYLRDRKRKRNGRSG